MSANSPIEWTDHTFNPWWGCMKVSAGCAHCYAESLSNRYGHNVWGPASTTSRRFFGEKHWAEPLKWDAAAAREGVRRRVFCASMADVFEDHPDIDNHEARDKLWELIERTDNLDWLLLTKRPENVMEMVHVDWRYPHVGFPPNIWIGTSAEHQAAADERVPILMKIPARVRFLSCEPLLGPIDLDPWLTTYWHGGIYDPVAKREGSWICTKDSGEHGGIHWVIAGGESGAKHRPMQPDWARSLRDQCVAAGVAFHFKQWGGRIAKSGGRELDGRTWDELPAIRLKAVYP